jgi:hypothetical protein
MNTFYKERQQSRLSMGASQIIQRQQQQRQPQVLLFFFKNNCKLSFGGKHKAMLRITVAAALDPAGSAGKRARRGLRHGKEASAKGARAPHSATHTPQRAMCLQEKGQVEEDCEGELLSADVPATRNQ